MEVGSAFSEREKVGNTDRIICLVGKSDRCPVLLESFTLTIQNNLLVYLPRTKLSQSTQKIKNDIY